MSTGSMAPPRTILAMFASLPWMDLAPGDDALRRLGLGLGHGESSLARPLLRDRAVLDRLTRSHGAPPIADGVCLVTLPVRIVCLARHVDRNVIRRVAERVHRVSAILDDLHLFAQQPPVEDDALVGLTQVLRPARRGRALAHPGVVVLARVVVDQLPDGQALIVHT